jgi:hypothetical protein
VAVGVYGGKLRKTLREGREEMGDEGGKRQGKEGEGYYHKTRDLYKA